MLLARGRYRPRRRATLAAAYYLLSSLAVSTHWLRPVRYVSAFYWSVGNNQISHGVSLADFAVMIGTTAGALVMAVIAFRRADLNSQASKIRASLRISACPMG